MEALWETNASAKSNMAATEQPFWSYLVKLLADLHYVGVNYKVFEDWQPIGELFCDNIRSFNGMNYNRI